MAGQDFYLDPKVFQSTDWAGAVARGYGLVNQMQAGSLRQGILQQEMQQKQAQQQALQQYGRTGDPAAFRGTDPTMEIKLKEYYDKQDPEGMKDIAKAADFTQRIAPNINSRSWPSIRPQMEKAYPKLPPDALPPLNATDQQLFQWANAAKIMDAHIKQMQQPGKISGGYYQPPGGGMPQMLPPTPLQKAQTAKAWADVEEPGRRWKPERFVPEKGEGPGIWIKPGEQVPQGYTSEKHKGALGSELDLSPEAIDAMARRYALDGTMPGLGLGKAATQARSKVMNRVAEIMAQEGQTPQDLKSNQIINAGLRAELTRTMGQRGPMLAFAKTADKNLDLASSLSEKVGRMGSPVINRWILAGRSKGLGDPDVASFDAAVRVAINEFAKVTSSATGGGVTSDQARKDIEGILYSAQTPMQFKAVVATLKTDMDNRVKGYDYQINNIQESLKQVGKPGSRGGVQDKMWKPGTPTASGWQGAGNYDIDGKQVYFNSEIELKQYLGGQ